MCRSSTNLSKSWSLDCIHSWCYSQLPLKLPAIFLQTHLELTQNKSKPTPEQQQKKLSPNSQPTQSYQIFATSNSKLYPRQIFTNHTSRTKKILHPIIPNHPQTPNPLPLYTYSHLFSITISLSLKIKIIFVN